MEDKKISQASVSSSNYLSQEVELVYESEQKNHHSKTTKKKIFIKTIIAKKWLLQKPYKLFLTVERLCSKPRLALPRENQYVVASVNIVLDRHK